MIQSNTLDNLVLGLFGILAYFREASDLANQYKKKMRLQFRRSAASALLEILRNAESDIQRRYGELFFRYGNIFVKGDGKLHVICPIVAALTSPRTRNLLQGPCKCDCFPKEDSDPGSRKIETIWSLWHGTGSNIVA